MLQSEQVTVICVFVCSLARNIREAKAEYEAKLTDFLELG